MEILRITCIVILAYAFYLIVCLEIKKTVCKKYYSRESHEIKIQNKHKCELFSELYGVTVYCPFLQKEKCGARFYCTNNVIIRMCSFRVKRLGFKHCWEEIVILIGWQSENNKRR